MGFFYGRSVKRANKTLKNVKGAWVKDQEVTVDNGKVSGYIAFRGTVTIAAMALRSR